MFFEEVKQFIEQKNCFLLSDSYTSGKQLLEIISILTIFLKKMIKIHPGGKPTGLSFNKICKDINKIKKEFENRQIKDNIKNNFCIVNNIGLIRIKHRDIKNIKNILKNYFKNYKY